RQFAVTGQFARIVLASFMVLMAQPCRAYDVLLRWTVPSETEIAGYRVASGPSSGTYDQQMDVGALDAATNAGVVYYVYSNLQPGRMYTVAVRAEGSDGMWSDYSNEKAFNVANAIAPRANAGVDQAGAVADVFTVGAAPDQGVSYFWQQIAGPPATLLNRT